MVLRTLFISMLILCASFAFSEKINLSTADILVSSDIKPRVQQSAVRILQEEVQKRSGLTLNKIDRWSSDSNFTIALVLSETKKLSGVIPPKRQDKSLAEWQSEGYRIVLEKNDGKSILWIIGAESRAVIFAIGELLRKADITVGKFLIDEDIDFAMAPDYSLRGHQIGYRNTANSYDAWTVEQYDQYIRELALFGTNAIENIPPLGKDGSPHFKISREEMNVKMSKICDAYDIEYWVWTPATVDLTNPELRVQQIELHEANYKNIPRLDNVFFPGGDPGHNHPRDVMPFLKELYARMVKYHPAAGMWISLQGFSQEQIDYFYQYLREHQPTWLRGVVSGPSSPSISETRYRLPAQYKHRHYPDITHNVRCDYPALNFDQAFALTLGREGINPQPTYYAKIHGQYAPFTDGFVSYSDGCHDDVNKFIWSQRGWDSGRNVIDIVREYSKFFFSKDVENSAADGILALEQNWLGPITNNGSIEPTLAFWQKLESANPELSTNWRWQLLTLRAHYDAYVRRRKIYESNLEKEANNLLLKVDKLGSEKAMSDALELVNLADTQPIEQALRQKIEQYCLDLFNSIGLQTSVKKYQASGSQRGAILDFVDYPLNNRWWLADQFEKIRQMDSEADKAARIKLIANWEYPGPGSYYDDISNIANSPHVKTTVYDAVDFGWWDDGYSRWRLSSQTYQNDPILEYEDLDPNARYIIRVAGFGDALIRVDGQRLQPLVYNKELEGFKEFIVPRQAVGDGRLRVTFDRPEESHLNWRNYSRVSDVWLIKR